MRGVFKNYQEGQTMTQEQKQFIAWMDGKFTQDRKFRRFFYRWFCGGNKTIVFNPHNGLVLILTINPLLKLDLWMLPFNTERCREAINEL